MKVDFKDCKFGDFKPNYYVVFNHKKFRAIEVNVTLDNGSVEIHKIAEIGLENELHNVFGEDITGTIDDWYSYYATNDESIYSILEDIIDEKMS